MLPVTAKMWTDSIQKRRQLNLFPALVWIRTSGIGRLVCRYPRINNGYKLKPAFSLMSLVGGGGGQRGGGGEEEGGGGGGGGATRYKRSARNYMERALLIGVY
jgi:hypothetical protein